jgi:hypothetical protein
LTTLFLAKERKDEAQEKGNPNWKIDITCKMEAGAQKKRVKQPILVRYLLDFNNDDRRIYL